MNREVLGKEYPPYEFPIEAGKIREMANAAFDDNPIYFDKEFAKKKGYSSLLAPPNFSVVSMFYSNWQQVHQDLARKPGHTSHAEEECIYFKPIVAGDVLTGQAKVVDIFDKKGRRGGDLTFAVIEETFHNQRKEKVLVVRTTLMEMSEIVG